MNKDIQKTALRLPRELHTSIHKTAAKSGRTMNAEIVYHLQKAMDCMMGEPPIQDTMIKVDPDMTNTVDMYAAIDPDFARVIHALIQYQQIKSGKC
ncbi:MAG: Arc family DNA-binding protein [Aeromonas sp.]